MTHTNLKQLTTKLRKQTLTNEEGLTVIELIIVVVIIGILAAIVIPIFMNQQKQAIEATLKSDIRNAVTVIVTEATKTQGRMPAWLPNYATKSPDNSIIVDTSRSNQYVFCLVGSNPNVDSTYYYSSVNGELSETACPSVANGGVGGNPAPGGGGGGVAPPVGGGGFTPGSSFDEQREGQMEETRLLYMPIIHRDQSVSSTNVVRAQLATYGFDEIVQVTHQELVDMPAAELNEFDMVVTYHNAWSTPDAIVDKLIPYYEQGGKVLQDGDDNQAGKNPFIDEFSILAGSVGRLDYTPTRNTGLSPSFPYTFEASSYMSGSSSRCITSLKNGGVAIAESPNPTGNGEICAIVYAGNNSNDGRWVTHQRFVSLTNQSGKASIDWLLS